MATYEQISTGTPDHDYVVQLIEGYRASSVMMTAAELDIMHKIESGSDVTAKSLATSAGLNVNYTERLLNALVALKLLAKSAAANNEAVYSVTSKGRLLSSHTAGSLHGLATEVRSNATTMLDLPNTIKKGRGQYEKHHGCGSDQKHGEHHHGDHSHGHHHHGDDHEGHHHEHHHGEHHHHHEHHHGDHHHHHEHHHGDHHHDHHHGDHNHGEEKHGECKHGHHGSGEDPHDSQWATNETPEQLLEMYKGMDGELAPHAAKLVRLFDLSKHKKGVDLGGGSGALSFALARAYPKMEVILNDLPNVIEMVKKYFNPEHEKLNITFAPGDYFKTELPKADLFMLGMIAHHWSTEDSTKFLKQIYNTLPSGGALLMLDSVVNDTYDGPVGAMMMDLWMMSQEHGRIRSGREFREMLMAAGFEDVKVKLTQDACTYDLIYATKA